MGTPTVCLCMIVKNEAHVIKRCLDSVRPIIDAWCIVDTGSTDGTQHIVLEELKGLPGALHERPWQDFAHNRNEAIKLAAPLADYLLVIDADDVLATTGDGRNIPQFRRFLGPFDHYTLPIRDSDCSYRRTQLFRGTLGYRYRGVLHEVLCSPNGARGADLGWPAYVRHGNEGARSRDPDKYRKDAAVLEQALAVELDDELRRRYQFYLAQSWRDCSEHERALAAYKARADMGGWPEEVFYSLLEMGKLAAKLNAGDAVVTHRYLIAWEARPARAEPLCYLAAYLRQKNRPVAGLPFAREAARMPRPADILFVDDSVYEWRALDEYAVAASWAGKHDEAIQACIRTLSRCLPEGERKRVEGNLAFCREQAAGKPASAPAAPKAAAGGKRRR